MISGNSEVMAVVISSVPVRTPERGGVYENIGLPPEEMNERVLNELLCAKSEPDGGLYRRSENTGFCVTRL
jgi:hypothetical protein